jgi:hypothetical protein
MTLSNRVGNGFFLASSLYKFVRYYVVQVDYSLANSYLGTTRTIVLVTLLWSTQEPFMHKEDRMADQASGWRNFQIFDETSSYLEFAGGQKQRAERVLCVADMTDKTDNKVDRCHNDDSL